MQNYGFTSDPFSKPRMVLIKRISNFNHVIHNRKSRNLLANNAPRTRSSFALCDRFVHESSLPHAIENNLFEHFEQ